MDDNNEPLEIPNSIIVNIPDDVAEDLKKRTGDQLSNAVSRLFYIVQNEDKYNPTLIAQANDIIEAIAAEIRRRALSN